MNTLTASQRAVASALFINRPETLPGTRVVIDDDARRAWYATVSDAMKRERIPYGCVDEFCNIAGVPD